MRQIYLFSLIFVLAISCRDNGKNIHYAALMEQDVVNYDEVVQAFDRYSSNNSLDHEERNHFRKWKELAQKRVDMNGNIKSARELYRELKIYRASITKETVALTVSEVLPIGTKLSFERPNPSSEGDWKNIGPFGNPDIKWSATGNGAIDHVEMHPTDPATMFVSVRCGGLWKTTNYGHNWTPITDYFPTPHCSCSAISKSEPNIMYLGQGGDKIIWRSTDGGESWTNVSTGIDGIIFDIEIDPSNSNIVLSATTEGIFRTINGGSSWIKVIEGKYTDLNATDDWSVIGVAKDSKNNDEFITPSFLKSTNRGETWVEKVITSVPQNVVRVYLAFQEEATTLNITAFLVSNSGSRFAGLYKSVNGGDTFTEVKNEAYDYPNGVAILWKDLSELVDGYGGVTPYNSSTWVSGFYADPKNSDHLVTFREKLWTSNNGGRTWDMGPAYGSVTWADNRYMTHNNTKDSIYWCNDGGLWAVATSDMFPYVSRESIVEKNGDICISEGTQMDVSQMNKNVHITGGQDIGQVFSRNNISTHVASADVYRGRICPHDDSKFITGALFINIDGVKHHLVDNIQADHFNTKKIYGFTNNPDIKLVRSPDGQDAWEVDGFIGEKSPNTGGHHWESSVKVWKAIPSPILQLKPGTFEQSWANKDIAYLGDEGKQKLYITENLSSLTPTWTNLGSAPHLSRYRIATHANNENIVVVVAEKQAYISRNKGQLWQSLGNYPGNDPVTILIDKNTAEGVYVATRTTVWYKDETLTDWIEFNKGLPLQMIQDMRMAHYPDGDSKLFITKYGRGNWETPLYSELKEKESVQGHWKLDENSGKQVKDFSNKNRDGLAKKNGKWESDGKVDGAIDLNGNNSINIPDIQLNGDFTIALWMKLKGDINQNDGIVSSDGTGGDDIRFHDGYPMLHDGNSTILLASKKVYADIWTHISITRKEGTVKFYLDGVLNGQGTWDRSLTVGTIGKNSEGLEIDALLDDIRIYSRELSKDEINDLPGLQIISAPTELSANVINLNEVELTWTDNSMNELCFMIERKTNDDAFIVIDSVNSNFTWYKDIELQSLTTYTYRVTACSKGWKSLSSNTSVIETGNTFLGYWPFDETNGKIAKDLSGNSTNGTLKGNPQWIANGKVGGAIKFDGVGDWINIADIPLSSDFTIATWIKLDNWIDQRDGLAGNDTGGGAGINFYGSTPRMYTGGGDAVTSTIAVQPNKWIHVAITRESGLLHIYLDGVKTGSGSWSDVFLIGGLGRNSSGANTSASFDDYRVYQVALSVEEINELPGLAVSTDVATLPDLVISNLMIYPNPVLNQEFNFKNPGVKGKIRVDVYSLSGKVVHTETIPESKSFGKVTIRVKNRISGTYIVKVSCGNYIQSRKVTFK